MKGNCLSDGCEVRLYAASGQTSGWVLSMCCIIGVWKLVCVSVYRVKCVYFTKSVFQQ